MIEELASRFVNVLPTIIAVEAAFAFLICALAGRWGSAIYWISASVITIGVIMIPKWG